MKLLVVGCKLQGTEAIYLAKKAGFFVTAIDHNVLSCGCNLADCFLNGDVYDSSLMIELFKKNDAVLPAVEDVSVCRKLIKYGKITNTPVIFDENAYNISSSKEKSNMLFKKLGLPVPLPYPECEFPVMIKPDNQSGSSGVEKASSVDEMKQYLEQAKSKCVIQEYLEGRSFSLEVLSWNGTVCFPMITEVLMDKDYDCNRIVAPAKISEDEEKQMYQIAESLVNSLNIKGIFDIEVISHHGTLKLLEIDARLPSQTPIAVYHSSGFNMVEWLIKRSLNLPVKPPSKSNKVCWYQQILVSPEKICVLVEHIMTIGYPLHHEYDFFGADEALTDYTLQCNGKFRATVIIYGTSEEEVSNKFMNMVQKIQKRFCIPKFEDSYLSKTLKGELLCQG